MIAVVLVVFAALSWRSGMRAPAYRRYRPLPPSPDGRMRRRPKGGVR